MKSEISILISSGIELTEATLNAGLSINGEIETRLNTSRKINRSLDNLKHGYNYDCFEGFDLDTLLYMKKENDNALQSLYDLKKAHSPFYCIVPKVLTRFEAGAIVSDSWGCEQTNIDYYCIVKRSGLWVTLIRMKQHRSAEIGFMTNKETPLEIDFKENPIKKKMKINEGKEIGFSLRNYSGGGWISLYNGEPKTSTHYA